MSIKDNLIPIVDGCEPLSYPYVEEICQIADSQDCEIFLVGGLLRDSIFYKKNGGAKEHLDIDFAVNKIDAVKFAQIISEKLNGHFVLLDNKNDTARVVLEDGTYLDFAGCVGGSIEADVKRRDFSINALVWSHKEPNYIYDATSGVSDLEKGLIRLIDEANLIDDPLRLLRAFRFSAQFGFEIESQTFSLIEKHSQLIEKVPFERINYEFFKMMESARTYKLLETMGECGLLESVFLDLKQTRKVTANQFHHLGLFEHSLEAVNQTELYFDRAPDWVKQQAEKELCQGISRLAATKISCLLHDIGKPDTWNVTDEGKHTFIGHDKLGATMVQELGKKIKWSKPLTRFITSLVEWHLRPGQLFHQGEPTPKAINRLYRTANEDFPELMLLAFGDLGATKGKDFTQDKRKNLEDNFKRILDGYPTYLDSLKTMPRLMDGKEVMTMLQIDPGPTVGLLLESLEEAQVLKEVTDKAQARVFVEKLYKKKYSS